MASNSPRRKQLLGLGGWDFNINVADIDETPLEGETPKDHVLRLAQAKALAVKDKVGVPVFTDAYLWKNNPEKVFGMTKKFAEKNPNTVVAITKALIRAGYWLDESRENRIKAVEGS